MRKVLITLQGEVCPMGVRQFWSNLLNSWTWGYDARIKGRRVKKIGFATEENAQLALAIRRVKANERRAGIVETAGRVTVKQLVDARIKQIGEKTYSRKHACVTLRAWLAMLPDGLLVEELKRAHIAKYRDARLEKIKPQSVNRELKDVMSCLNAASEIFPELEEWRPPKRPKLKVPKGYRKVTISPEQIRKILARLRRVREEKERAQAYRARLDAADGFEVALECLGRKGEVRTLEWDHIYWQAKKLQLDSKKTDSDDIIFISDSLLALFERRRAAQKPPSRYIFPSDRNPERPISRIPIHLVKRAAEECGIPWGYDKPNGIVFHTTRHTAVTALLEAGYDLPTVQAQSRHSTQQMLMRYGHARAENRRATAETLSAFLASPEPEKVSTLAATSDTFGSDNSEIAGVKGKGKPRGMAAKAKS